MNYLNLLAGFVSLGCLFVNCLSHSILVLHPVYAGSHIIAIRTILEELVRKGHKIKVIRWKESSRIPPMETENFSETILSIDNSEGLVPFLTKEVKSSFEFPDKLMWERGLNPSSVLDGGIDTVASSCDTLFQQKELIQELKASNFKVAIVDLLYNECGLALAHYLGLPVVAYWAISFVSGEIQYTTAFNPPSSIPHIYFPYTEMNFLQRCLNFIFAICNHILMQVCWEERKQ
ncbi:putative UDP-glucuronosyltransferase ugt-48 [Armadillidium nasatum]|uniref:Putative UDP-glucuronosyltransferase ugt-48 n=1 Tax=Armadillidium nasatum TaxID=96803 RepID=A0A5N5T856_9CRUS|nr:putative UDP-glucuronosyltransferase ugt-48 [Armadillidium nasatum]